MTILDPITGNLVAIDTSISPSPAAKERCVLGKKRAPIGRVSQAPAPSGSYRLVMAALCALVAQKSNQGRVIRRSRCYGTPRGLPI
jgi:hypothetical protein